MKRLSYVYLFLFTFILSACTHQFFFGPERHGLNKVIKSDQTERPIEDRRDSRKTLAIEEVGDLDSSGLVFQENNTVNSDTGEVSSTNKKVELPFLSSMDSVPLKERVRSAEREWSTTIKKITRERKSDVPSADDDTSKVGWTIVIIILLILVGLILLSILFIYLLALALGQAFEEVLEQFGCYVATMCYGSYDHPKVITLRKFRDRFLAKYTWGRQFTKWYYRNSPGFTQFYAGNKFVHFFLRIHLDVFVFLIRPFFRN